MDNYDVTVGIIGLDIFLDDNLTLHDYNGYIAEQWMLNGTLSRITGPALTIFRANDPKCVCPTETLAQFWYLDGKLHNNYAAATPAYMVRDPASLYEEMRDYEHGVLHNHSGAAVRNQFERQYYLHGRELTEEEFKKHRADSPSMKPPAGPN